MAENFKWYLDQALTQQATGAALYMDVNTVSGSEDFVRYLGSQNAAVKLVDRADPGVNAIVIEPDDSDPGNGHETSGWKIAASEVGLDSATPGAGLDIGTEVLGGVGNAVAVWFRLTDETAGTENNDTTTFVKTLEVSELPV